MRDFMASRRIGGVQQIKVAITFHSAGKQILWPYGYTTTDVPADMTVEDHAALVAMGRKILVGGAQAVGNREPPIVAQP